MVKCEICSKEMKMITGLHLKNHGTSLVQYRIDYPDSPTMTEETRLIRHNSAIVANADLDRRKKHSERMSGENNPFFGKVHDKSTRQRMSTAIKASWSKNYDRLSVIVAANAKHGSDHPSWIGGKVKGGKKHKSRMAALDVYGTACLVCGFDTAVHCHHIVSRAQGGSYGLENCIILCPNHHAMADAGLLSREYLLELIAPFK